MVSFDDFGRSLVSERLEEIRQQIAGLQAEQRLRDILPLLRESVELTREEAGEDSSAYVAALNELGSLCRTLRELEASEEAFVRAAEIEARVRGIDNPDYATCINNLAGTYRLKHDYETAVSLFKQSIEIYERQMGTEHFVYLSALNNLGLVYQDLQRYEEAEALHRKALDGPREERQAERRLCDDPQQPGCGGHGYGTARGGSGLSASRPSSCMNRQRARDRCSTSQGSTTWRPPGTCRGTTPRRSATSRRPWS